MHKIHREGVDVDLAFVVASKHLKNANARVEASHKDGSTIPNDAPISAEVSTDPATRPSAKRIVKKAARPLARAVYRAAKPIIRPILFRLRAYFTDGLRQEIVHEIKASSSATTKELKVTIDALRRELLEALKRESQIASATGVQEAQATREALRQETERLLAHVERLDRIEDYSYATARRIAVNCAPGEILIRTAVGFAICSATDHALIATLLESGELEPGTRLLIQKLLNPGDTYVDVGANIGMHVLAAARTMQGQGKIFAFEPFEPTQRMLEKTVWMNGFSDITEIHQAAAFNVEGTQRLYLGATSGHHSLYELENSAPSPLSSVEVPLVRLDSIIPSDQKVDLLKIDAEGAELEVLEGGSSLIANNEDITLIMEFGTSHLDRTNHQLDQWLATFDRLGLTYRVINPYSGTLEMWSREQLEGVESVNLFLAREGSKAWGRLGT